VHSLAFWPSAPRQTGREQSSILVRSGRRMQAKAKGCAIVWPLFHRYSIALETAAHVSEVWKGAYVYTSGWLVRVMESAAIYRAGEHAGFLIRVLQDWRMAAKIKGEREGKARHDGNAIS